MDIQNFWHIQQPLSVKSERSSTTEVQPESYQFCDGNLNFSTASVLEEDDFHCNRKRGSHQISRDPMSHRVIEKRRRDRMNNCLADLSRLIPADYLKKGRGRIEKTEIIEMAIKHMKYLQIQASKINSLGESSTASQSPTSQDEGTTSSSTPTPTPTPTPSSQHTRSPSTLEGYRVGYQECVSETLHFMVEVEGFFAGDPLCLELVNHLQRHCDKIMEVGKRQSESTTSSSPNIYEQNPNNADTSSSSPSPHSSEGNKDANQSDQKDVKPFEKKRTPGPSQLRKMLTCPSMSLHNIDYPPNGSDPILYKFKNNIKQRFSEEHDGLKRRRFEIPEIKRRYSDSCTTASPLNSPDLFTSPCSSPKPSPYGTGKAVAFGIPIFALHANGSFYIPITIESDILAPFLKELTKAAEENQSYHPVTISVSFPQSLRMLRSPYMKDMLVLKGMQSAQGNDR